MSSQPGRGAGMTLIACACAVSLIGCGGLGQGSRTLVDGSGAVRTETRVVDLLDEVEIRHGIDLRLAVGPPQRVSMAAQANLLGLTTTIVSDGRLIVEAGQDFVSSDGITADVSMPTISELVLRDGATGHVEGVAAAMLSIYVDHGASLAMTGTTGWLGLSSHGACVIDLGGFVARDAEVELAQGVMVQLGVTGSISGSLTGGVVLTISGQPPIVDVTTSGGSTIVRR
jgi:hypothetical protein